MDRFFYISFKLTLTLVFLVTISSQDLLATHNRAGEITYIQLPDEPFAIFATVTTYTKESSDQADRDSLEVCWGDGTCDWVLRSNGLGSPPQGEILPNDTKKNLYVMKHLYPGPGHYIISMQDANRNGQILNVNPPNSEQIEFFLQTTVTLFGSQFQNLNNSPVLLQPPIDIGCVGKRFIHNPNAFDVDGDSLSYKLIIPKRDIDVDVPLYRFPDQVNPGGDNIFNFSETTGQFIWDAPQQEGEYNIAMYIIEHRDGMPLDTMIRDMQILIQTCDNLPPEIETEDLLCVVAGDVIEFDMIATDPDVPLQQIEISALGGPFEVAISPATFIAPEGYQDQPVIGTFRWETQCEHISDQFYTVVFKAVDDFFPNTNSGLATLKTVRIKIVGPPPLDLQGEADNSSIRLSWESPYACENAEDEYFRGFSVWRRIGSNQFPIDNCVPGLAGRGYSRITFQTEEIEDGRYVFVDEGLERGNTYCYRILAEFARISTAGNAFNLVESLPSEELCLQLSRDLPLITHVDVNATDPSNGEIIVQWTKPLAEDLDTILNPGPYVYEIWRAPGITATGFEPIPGALFSSATFSEDHTTFYLDENLNTLETPYSYQVAFYVNNESEPLGFTSDASSVYLDIAPTDEANILTWEFDVPWVNYEYTIYRMDPGSMTFDSIDVTTDTVYIDRGLINGEEYCYFVQTTGSYGVEGIVNPIINRSQEKCSIPFDNVPPCPPPLTVSNICDSLDIFVEEDLFENLLEWQNPNLIEVCEETDDVERYNIYYANFAGEELMLIGAVSFAEVTEYVDSPEFGVAGCYAVTAIDSTGNESAFSNIVCVDNCPLYELPNVFTPNGDNANDFYIPIAQRFIDRVDMQIFNRWGGLVHTNSLPQLNWNGTNLDGQDLEEGVYFYVCKVYENRVNGIVLSDEILSGFIELRRGN